MSETILIFGSNGQIGTVLTAALAEKYGSENVITTDIREPASKEFTFHTVDVTDRDAVFQIIEKTAPTQIYHLAAILSANGEKNPAFTWKVNVQGYLNVLDGAVKYGVNRVFFPSTIAVFGDTTPKENTPQACPLLPTTVYGMSKVSGENWSNYYHQRYGLDVRSLRYPGVIGYQSIPEGGTTDYAVEIFHSALKGETYTCFLEQDTVLPMVYMPDAVKATIDLMSAASESINIRYSYNLTSMSFAPKDIAKEIDKIIPGFNVDYQPDFRQKIAASWSQTIDDSNARKDWNWRPDYDLSAMSQDMINQLRHLY